MATDRVATKARRISETARSAAMFRAAHLLLDETPHVFEDTFARALSGYDDDVALLEAFRQRPHGIQQARGLFAVRSRYTEDALGRAIARGVQQYVVLGAGLDSFGLRSSEHPRVRRVFEVDQPQSQDWKRARIKALGWELSPAVRYVPCDLSSDPLWPLLLEAGLNEGAPGFFSCLGVTQYLTSEAVHRLLDQVALAPSGSELIIQYQEPIADAPAKDQQMLRYFAEASARLGEPWLSFFPTESMRALLKERGFKEVTHFDSVQARDLYLRDRRDDLTVPDYLHILHARR